MNYQTIGVCYFLGFILGLIIVWGRQGIIYDNNSGFWERKDQKAERHRLLLEDLVWDLFWPIKLLFWLVGYVIPFVIVLFIKGYKLSVENWYNKLGNSPIKENKENDSYR